LGEIPTLFDMNILCPLLALICLAVAIFGFIHHVWTVGVMSLILTIINIFSSIRVWNL